MKQTLKKNLHFVSSGFQTTLSGRGKNFTEPGLKRTPVKKNFLLQLFQKLNLDSLTKKINASFEGR